MTDTPGEKMTHGDPRDRAADEPRDRARRRLIKLGIYITPAIINMTAYLRRAAARPAATPHVDPGANARPGGHPDAQATVNPR